MTAKDSERAKAAAVLFKGVGLLFSQKHASSEPAYKDAAKKLTGRLNQDFWEFFANPYLDLIREALSAMPSGDVKTVTESALGGGVHKGQSLADRRRLVANRLGISQRTVFRYEARGVSQLIKHIDRIREERRREELRRYPIPPIPAASILRVEQPSGLTAQSHKLLKQIEEIDETNDGPEASQKMLEAVRAFVERVDPPPPRR